MVNHQQKTTIVSPGAYLELDNQGRKVRLELTKETHILGRDANRCDLVVPSDWAVLSSCHAVLKKVGMDYKIFDGDGSKPSTNGLFADRTRITPTEGLSLQSGIQLRIGQDPRNQIQLHYHNPLTPSVPQASKSGKRSLRLKEGTAVIGRDPGADFPLDSPMISRKHVTIESQGSGRYLLRDHSTNGVFANGRRVNGTVLLSDCMTLNIGPFVLIFQGHNLSLVDSGTQIRLDATQLVWEVKDQKGKRNRILDNLTLAIEPGQFVALVGGSGAGKSTLMRTLLGTNPITSGQVFINGTDIKTNFNIYRTQIGYVPQDDIIHGELTVEEVLTYAAKLRLPADADLRLVIAETIEQIEMTKYRNILVKKLSGGQRKRVSIGVELLADPKLFFLDEPTSGLDPGLDKKMMLLLQKLASQGRTIILVTHATANINMCDRIVFLGRGGKLCYFGPPQQAGDFFNINTGDFADIYNELERGEEIVQKWAHHYSQSPYFQKYIANHLSLNSAKDLRSPPRQVKPSPVKQMFLLSQRSSQLILRDRVSLGLSLLTAPIGIGLITLAVRDKPPLIQAANDPALASSALRVLFVFTCAAIWVGLSGSLQEIVKESAIYFRERLVNLSLGAYLGSKGLTLGILTLVQTALIVATVSIGFQSPTPATAPWAIGLGITSFLTLFSSLSLGLMVSALVKNSSQANSALPLLLLPQIIFSGVLFKSEGISRMVSWLMMSRWSIGAYGSLVDTNAMIPAAKVLPNGETLPLPLEPSAVYDPTWSNLLLNWGMLIVHTAIYLGITAWAQKRKDIL
jgi:ABC transport system ATP-binding/permease protein